MEKEFVEYTEALELKELGFDEPCFKYVYIGDTGNNFDHYLEVEPSKAKNYNEDDLCISQPTFSQTFRWFREKHNIYAIILPSYADDKVIKNRFFYEIADGNKLKQELNYHSAYEEAELACIEKLISIVKVKL